MLDYHVFGSEDGDSMFLRNVGELLRLHAFISQKTVPLISVIHYAYYI
jgi:hypothetical protein